MSLLKIGAYVSVILIRGRTRGAEAGLGGQRANAARPPGIWSAPGSRAGASQTPRSGAGSQPQPKWNTVPLAGTHSPRLTRAVYPSTHCGSATMLPAHTHPQRKAATDSHVHMGFTCTGVCVWPSHALTLLEMKISCLTNISGSCMPSPPLGGTRGEQSPLRVMHSPRPGPYLSTRHHGEGHLVPKVKFSTCKLHGSLQALGRGRRSALLCQDTPSPSRPPGSSLPKPWPGDRRRPAWFWSENLRGFPSMRNPWPSVPTSMAGEWSHRVMVKSKWNEICESAFEM